MINKEFYNFRNDGAKLYNIFSDLGYTIIKDGTNEEYDNAIELEDSNTTYTETTNKILDYKTLKENIIIANSWEQEAENAYLKGVNEA